MDLDNLNAQITIWVILGLIAGGFALFASSKVGLLRAKKIDKNFKGASDERAIYNERLEGKLQETFLELDTIVRDAEENTATMISALDEKSQEAGKAIDQLATRSKKASVELKRGMSKINSEIAKVSDELENREVVVRIHFTIKGISSPIDGVNSKFVNHFMNDFSWSLRLTNGDIASNYHSKVDKFRPLRFGQIYISEVDSYAANDQPSVPINYKEVMFAAVFKFYLSGPVKVMVKNLEAGDCLYLTMLPKPSNGSEQKSIYDEVLKHIEERVANVEPIDCTIQTKTSEKKRFTWNKGKSFYYQPDEGRTQFGFEIMD